jgi:hypothetical protein
MVQEIIPDSGRAVGAEGEGRPGRKVVSVSRRVDSVESESTEYLG